MNLTTKQLTEIKAFIKKKGYPEPDIQMELLDHLACGIEERMESGVPFEKAFRDTYNSFGIFGFTDFVDGITKGHEKVMQNQVKIFLKKCFTLPWIIVLALSIYALYLSFLTFKFNAALAVGGLSTVTFYWMYFKKFFKKERKYRNLSIIKTSNALSSGGVGAVIASFQIWNYFDKMTNQTVAIAFSILWIYSILFMYATSFIIKQYAVQRAEELERLYGSFD
jgi:hypothetical protein